MVAPVEVPVNEQWFEVTHTKMSKYYKNRPEHAYILTKPIGGELERLNGLTSQYRTIIPECEWVS